MRNSGALATVLAWAVALVGAAGTARGQEFTFSVDIPTELQGTQFMANQTIDYSAAGLPNYVLQFDGGGLEEYLSIDALTLLADGSFLFSTDAPFMVGADTYTAYDVVKYDLPSDTFSLHVSGAALGLSESANVDALAFDEIGRLVISLDAPENVGGTDFEYNDLLVIDGGTLSVLVSGAAIGLPPELNVSGYERAAGGSDLFHFASPITLGALDFTRSDIAQYSAGTWTVLFHDPAFPEESAGADFSLPCAGPHFPGTLFVGKTGGSTEVSWTAGGIGLFDLVRGDLGELLASGGDFKAALDAISPVTDVCMEDDTLFHASTDTKADPTPGAGYFYVLRPVAGCRAGGTYDGGGLGQSGTRDAEIAAAAGDCP